MTAWFRKPGRSRALGIAYNVKKTGTVLRVAYARTFETPFNENLLLSSATGIGGLAQNVFGSVGVPHAARATGISSIPACNRRSAGFC